MEEYVGHVSPCLGFTPQQNPPVVMDGVRVVILLVGSLTKVLPGRYCPSLEEAGHTRPVCDHSSCSRRTRTSHGCAVLYRDASVQAPSLTSDPALPQIDGQSGLKASEQERRVAALPPKEACKCHKEDLARAFHVRVDFASDAG